MASNTVRILNEVLKRHTETINEIDAAFLNYTKAPVPRRTVEYLQRVEKNVREMWSQSLKTHEKIKELDPERKSEYFTKNLFEASTKDFNGYLARFEIDRKKFKDTESDFVLKLPDDNIPFMTLKGTTKEKDSEELDVSAIYDESQSIILQFKLTNFNKKLACIHKDQDNNNAKTYYSSLLTSLDKKWEEIELDWIKIQTVNYLHKFEDAGMATLTSSINNSQVMYTEYCKFLHEKLQECDKKPAQAAKLNIPLPPLKLIPFSGLYSDWPNFREYYETTIHNNPDLTSNVVKNDYLCTLIKDKESLDIIGHLMLNSANYETTWSLLKDRIGNPRRISDALIDKFMDISKMEFKSARGLKEIHDKTKEVLFGLYNQGLTEKQVLELIILRIIHKKLDYTSIEAVEKSLYDTKQVPVLDEVLSTLLAHAYVLENVKDSKVVKSPMTKSTANNLHYGSRAMVHMTKPGRICEYCQKPGHMIVDCANFKGLEVPRRVEFIKRKKICYNCLSHVYTDPCMSKSCCRICQRRHHTILHLERARDENEENSSATFHNL